MVTSLNTRTETGYITEYKNSYSTKEKNGYITEYKNSCLNRDDNVFIMQKKEYGLGSTVILVIVVQNTSTHQRERD